jgi:hypothetical protein
MNNIFYSKDLNFQTYRKCPTCISLAIFGDEKSITTLGGLFFLLLPTRFKTLGGKTPFDRIFRICLETNDAEIVMLIKPGPENSV